MSECGPDCPCGIKQEQARTLAEEENELLKAGWKQLGRYWKSPRGTLFGNRSSALNVLRGAQRRAGEVRR